MAGLENRRARHDYEILETYEAGLVLKGTEVKSLRSGQADFTGTFAHFRGGELFLEDLYIAPYDKGGYTNHDPRRLRKLLLNRGELVKLRARVEQKGLTLIPLKIYFNDKGRAKLMLALGRGKRDYQKKEDDKKRAVKREMENW